MIALRLGRFIQRCGSGAGWGFTIVGGNPALELRP